MQFISITNPNPILNHICLFMQCRNSNYRNKCFT